MSEPKPIEVAIAMYQSARAELVERIRLRDQILMIYLAAVGALFTAGFGVTPRFEVLLSLPFLALGASVLVCQHNAVIGSLGRFCVVELGAFLDGLKSHAPQWDDSSSLQSYKDSAIRLRSFGHTVILIVPCVVALGANYPHAISSPFPYGPLWWMSAICTVVTVWQVVTTHFWRSSLYFVQSWRRHDEPKSET
jgi:hypothetical protein